jgi:hypothetical protein
MKVVNLKIADLKPHPRNYRSHGPRQLEDLRASLKSFGWQRNVVVSKDSYILAGHGIVEAATLEGMTDAPCVAMEFLHDHPMAEKFLAVENTVSRGAEDDQGLLSALLADVERTVGLDGTGYSAAELDALIADVGEGPLTTEITIKEPENPPNTFVVACIPFSSMAIAGPLLNSLKEVPGIVLGTGATG